ncbi:hypothetical protein XVE_0611 [Xanthomonas vesicatoria ATCC 35937]|uniref:Uncharacterized protein n=1 Tax=Xanthomonas vesicatoria ATCC 35937 TaxID=925775 RepID=F0B995_9XANT|nr:hypothetical protein XVE_0611 [Xanthomonas vesicatoria ATCC 35937]
MAFSFGEGVAYALHQMRQCNNALRWQTATQLARS